MRTSSKGGEQKERTPDHAGIHPSGIFNTPSNLHIFNPHRSVFQVHRQDWMQSYKARVSILKPRTTV